MLDSTRPVCVLAETAAEAERAIRGLHSVAFFDVAGFVLGGGDEQTTSVTVDELDSLIAAGAAVIDVREKDDRDTGYIPGSRNVPYRLMALVLPRPSARPARRDDLRHRPTRGDRREHPPHSAATTSTRSPRAAWSTGLPAAAKRSSSGAAAHTRRGAAKRRPSRRRTLADD